MKSFTIQVEMMESTQNHVLHDDMMSIPPFDQHFVVFRPLKKFSNSFFEVLAPGISGWPPLQRVNSNCLPWFKNDPLEQA